MFLRFVATAFFWARSPALLVLAFVTAALLVPPQAWALSATSCPARSAGSPQVTVVVLDPEPRLSREATVAALHVLSGQPQRADFHHLGVTVLRTEWRGEIQAPAVTGAEGACAVVEHVRVTLANAEHRVLIAREIPQGTCLFQVVETHERRHVTANRQALREAAAPVRRALEAWAAGAEAWAATPETAREALQAGLQAAMALPVAVMRERRDAANRAIDSPDEYRRLAQSCALDQVRLQDRLRNP